MVGKTAEGSRAPFTIMIVKCSKANRIEALDEENYFKKIQK